MSQDKESRGIEKLPTGIEGLDLIANGGLPRGRTTLVSGTAGSGKTIIAVQYLVEGIVKAGERGVFVTFEETPGDIRKNMLGLGWDIQQWEDEGKWAFVDACHQPGLEIVESGAYDLGALTARIEHAIRMVGATRVSVDSLGAVFSQFSDSGTVRRELFRITAALRQLGVTAIMTAEREDEYGAIARYGVEEFVADNVIVVRNVLELEKRRRTIEMLKFRGTDHQKGEWPFTVLPGQGIVVIPLSGMQLKQKSSTVRISSGIAKLDAMCNGGFFRDSIILVSGATGTGKTLTSTHFIGAGAETGERCVLFAFEESRDQLFRNAVGWGIDFQKMDDNGNLKVVCAYPESAGLENHFVTMRDVILEFKPTRVAVDSLSALERVSTEKSFREFVISLTSFIKTQEVGGLFTSTTPTLMGGTSVTEAHISTITDTIVLLRYAEMFGEVRRGITVLKMRGSMHDKDICEVSIDGTGMHVGKPFRNVTGILTGTPQHVSQDEFERVGGMFKEEAYASSRSSG